MSSFLKYFLFFSMNAPVILEFVQDLIERLRKETTTASVLDRVDVLATEYAAKYPDIAKSCVHIEHPNIVEGEMVMQTAAGARGAFRDLIQFVIQNPDKAIELFVFFKDLFGLKVPVESTPGDDAADTSVDVTSA